MSEILRGYLWFNSSKDVMRRRLESPHNNSGVGISLPYVGEFRRSSGQVTLKFDDGTQGTATVDKDSFFGGCCHLIDNSIGAWARKNGLWARKLRPGRQSVVVYLSRIDKGKSYAVAKARPSAG